MMGLTVSTGETDLGAKLRFLASPRAHAPGSGRIEWRETHMSWLFFDQHTVLKLKKPVCYPPHLDCRTLAQRERDARAELTLNRRLAPEVYLDLLALRWDGGAMSLVPESAPRAPGQVLDWLVKMKRLPADRMLDEVIRRGALQPAQVESLARLLCDFYARAARAPVDAAQHLARWRSEQAIHRDVLGQPRFDLTDAHDALAWLDHALTRQAGALAQRVAHGWVVDGHGDLRTEHVCLVEPPVVIDCLTFADALRHVDPFEDISALALECAQLDAAWVGDTLVERLAQRLGGAPPPDLMRLYRVNREVLRARLAVAHLLDDVAHDTARWLGAGRRHLARALQCARGGSDR